MKIEKKGNFNLYSHPRLARKKPTHVNIMRFLLITWYFSLSNLSWIVINRRSNRLQRKQEHKYDLYYCTCIQRQHQNVMTTSKCDENNKLAYMGQQSVSMLFNTFLMSTVINSNCTNTWQNGISLFCICDPMAPRVIHPLHPNISIYILYTLLYLFPLVLTRRTYLKIKASCVGDHFLYSHDLNEWFSSITVSRN